MKIDLDTGLLKSLLVLGAVIEARDAYTGGHVWRVAHFSELIAKESGLSGGQSFRAFIGGLVHDIGKVGVPDAILNKPGKLTEAEYEIMRTHPDTGRKILTAHPLAPLVIDAIGFHHEWVDGHGYPKHVGKENISIFARIVSIADAFDAMTSRRSYRVGMSKDKAISILRGSGNSQFDGPLVSVLAGLCADDRLEGIVGHSDHARPMLDCPACGPTIAVPRCKSDGDKVHCNACKAEFELHKEKDFFALKFTKRRVPGLRPEIDVEQIEEIVQKAPRQVEL